MRNEGGFTLLEILIALFVFTIVSVIMVTALHTVLTSQSVADKKAMRFTELQTALILLSRDLEQTVNRPINTTKDSIDLFIGTPSRIAFTHAGLTNPLGMLQRSTLQRTEYELTNQKLIRVTWPVLDQTAKSQPDRRILLGNVDSLRFEYLDDKGRFQNNWPVSDNNNNMVLPKAVRVQMTLSDIGNLTQLYLIPAQSVPRISSSSNTGTKPP